jgi:squalene-hopene/tetraprenyl-beta-curcumene cyclase
VSGLISETRRVGLDATASEARKSPVQSALETAIRRSQNHLLSIQKPEGYWVGELMVDSTLCSDMIAFHHWDGSVNKEWQRKAVNHIFSMQLPDGGWNIYHGGPSEVNATIKAYLGLKLAGVPVADPRMLRARQAALSLGGVPRMNTCQRFRAR